MTVSGYDRCVDTFVKQHMNLGKYEQFIKKFSDFLKKGSYILDLGCGPGNIAKFLIAQEKDYKILGVDLSVNMLQVARQYVPTEQFICADIRHLELERKFDAVIISFCIIHLDDNETNELFRKTYNLLNDEGYLYISFMHGGVSGFEKASFSENELFFNYFCPNEIEKALINLGFLIRVKHFHDYYRCDQIIKDVFIIAQK